jgi:hypothetical protein
MHSAPTRTHAHAPIHTLNTGPSPASPRERKFRVPRSAGSQLGGGDEGVRVEVRAVHVVPHGIVVMLRRVRRCSTDRHYSSDSSRSLRSRPPRARLNRVHSGTKDTGTRKKQHAGTARRGKRVRVEDTRPERAVIRSQLSGMKLRRKKPPATEITVIRH